MIRQVAELCGTLTALQGRYPIEVSGEPCLVLAILFLYLFIRPQPLSAERSVFKAYHSVIDFGFPFHRSYQPILMKFGMWLRLPFNRKDQVPHLT